MKYSSNQIMILPFIMMTMTAVNATEGINDQLREAVKYDGALTIGIVPDSWSGGMQGIPSSDITLTKEEFIAILNMRTVEESPNGDDNDIPLDELSISVGTEPDIDLPTDDSELIQHSLDNIDSVAARIGAVPSATKTYDVFSHAVLTLPDHPRNEKVWGKVITNQNDWESFFYAQTAHISYPVGEAPVAAEFDFEKYQILTGGLGIRSNGGYSFIVQSVSELDDVIELTVLEIRPSENCLSPQVISYPSATVLIKKTDKPFNITVSKLVEECLN